MKLSGRTIRYIIFFISIVIWVLSAKMFIGNFSIEKEIQNTIQEGEVTKEDTLWKEKFEKKYLETDYAQYFAKHSTRLILDGGDETLIKTKNSFNEQEIKIEENTEKTINRKIQQKTNQEKWNNFIKNKIRMMLDK